jgi:hypothetical protein
MLATGREQGGLVGIDAQGTASSGRLKKFARPSKLICPRFLVAVAFATVFIMVLPPNMIVASTPHPVILQATTNEATSDSQPNFESAQLEAAETSLERGGGPAAGRTVTCGGSSGPNLVNCGLEEPANGTSGPQTWPANATPTVQLSATPSNIVLGNYTSLIATISGPPAPWQITWSLPIGCQGQNRSMIVCQPQIAGAYEPRVLAQAPGRVPQTGGTSLQVTRRGSQPEACGGPLVCSPNPAFPPNPNPGGAPGNDPPAGRWAAGMAYDYSDGFVLLFGGFGCTSSSCSSQVFEGDTWSFNGQWSELLAAYGTSCASGQSSCTVCASSGCPTPRADPAMAYDPSASVREVVLYGGEKSTGWSDGDTWEFHIPAPPHNTPTWYNISVSLLPAPLQGASLAYDYSDSSMIMYGGYVTSSTSYYSTQVYNFTGSTWHGLTNSGPLPRNSEGLAYSGTDGNLVMYGGFGCLAVNSQQNCIGPPAALGDTWYFHLDKPSGGTPTWTEVWAQNGRSCASGQSSCTACTAADCPPSRYGPSVGGTDAYNTAFVAGKNGSTYYNDTWDYANNTWTRVTEPLGPDSYVSEANFVGRLAQGVGWNEPGHNGVVSVLVMFGGIYDYGTYAPLTGTWIDLHGSWSAPFLPNGRINAGMVYDTHDSEDVMFGGTNGTIMDDTWTMTVSTGPSNSAQRLVPSWTQLSPSSSPTARYEFSMVYDAADSYVLLYGGYGCTTSACTTKTTLSDTWSFSGGSWTQWATIGPQGEMGAGMAYDAHDGYVLLFGGCYSGGCGSGVSSETWKYLTGTWTQLNPTGSIPPALYEPAMGYDSAASGVYLYGGYSSSGASLDYNYVYSAGVWTSESSATGYRGASAAFETGSGAVDIVGGYQTQNPAGYYNDTEQWVYSTDTFTKICASGLPGCGYEPRAETSVAYATSIGSCSGSSCQDDVLFGGLGLDMHPISLQDGWFFDEYNGNWYLPLY